MQNLCCSQHTLTCINLIYGRIKKKQLKVNKPVTLLHVYICKGFLNDILYHNGILSDGVKIVS